MPPTKIVEEHHLLRHVKGRDVQRDPETREPIGLFFHAFEQKKDEEYLSAAWPEYFSPSLEESIPLAQADFRSVLSVRRNDLFALGIVGEIKAACASMGVQIRVTSEPEAFPSHAAVRRFGNAPDRLLELLAAEAWATMVRPIAFNP